MGKLRDLAIRWEGDTPRVTGIKYAKGIQKHIPVEQLDLIKPDRINLARSGRRATLVPLAAR